MSRHGRPVVLLGVTPDSEAVLEIDPQILQRLRGELVPDGGDQRLALSLLVVQLRKSVTQERAEAPAASAASSA